MAGIYIYSESKDLAAELVGFARGTGKPAILLTLDEKTAEELKNSCADKIMLITGSSELIENYARAIADVLVKEGAELLAVGATARGRDLAARIAGYLDGAMASDVTAANFADGKLMTTRMLYGGAVQQSEALAGLSVITIPAGKFEPVNGETPVETIELAADNRVSLVETAPIVKQGADLVPRKR
jgi:electron transfer flavoprotein alpha subunit